MGASFKLSKNILTAQMCVEYEKCLSYRWKYYEKIPCSIAPKNRTYDS